MNISLKFLKYLYDLSRHLTYPQVQKCLPSNLPRAQETYFRVVCIKINFQSYLSFIIYL